MRFGTTNTPAPAPALRYVAPPAPGTYQQPSVIERAFTGWNLFIVGTLAGTAALGFAAGALWMRSRR